MSGYAVADLVALKAVDSTTPKTRFVISKITWYYCDPASSATADNENVVEPNSSIGRWFKIRSVNETSDVINWQEQPAGNFTASTGVGYILNLSAGDTELTLPSTASVGQIIGIIKINNTNYGTNRVIIKRNGNLINGEAFDRQIIHKYQQVVFRYLGSAGWIISSTTHPVLYYNGTITNFAKPTNLSDLQRGIFDFCGKGFNTGGTWSNPISSGNIRISRYADASGSSPVYLTDQVLTGTTDGTSTSFAAEGTASYNVGAFQRGFMHIGFRSSSGRISQARITDFYWHNAVITASAYRNLPNWLYIYGSNDPEITTILSYGNTQNVGDKRYNLFPMLRLIDMKLIASLDLSATAGWPIAAAGTAYRDRYISFTNTEFFSDYILISDRGDVAVGVGGTTSDAPFRAVNEIEAYGDIQTIYVP